MTKVKIVPGICGFTVTVSAVKEKDKKVSITVDTECEMVNKMAEDIQTLGLTAAFSGHLNNPVYRSAAQHLKHVACPVPSGILKALEVELGLCLPKDSGIHFLKD